MKNEVGYRTNRQMLGHDETELLCELILHPTQDGLGIKYK